VTSLRKASQHIAVHDAHGSAYWAAIISHVPAAERFDPKHDFVVIPTPHDRTKGGLLVGFQKGLHHRILVFDSKKEIHGSVATILLGQHLYIIVA
jgi:hypothetical protein